MRNIVLIKKNKKNLLRQLFSRLVIMSHVRIRKKSLFHFFSAAFYFRMKRMFFISIKSIFQGCTFKQNGQRILIRIFLRVCSMFMLLCKYCPKKNTQKSFLSVILTFILSQLTCLFRSASNLLPEDISKIQKMCMHNKRLDRNQRVKI